MSELLQVATPEGRLYALVGLKKVAPDRFEAAVGLCRRQMSGKKVKCASGCLFFESPAIEVIDAIGSGKWALPEKTKNPASPEKVRHSGKSFDGTPSSLLAR
ncbi:MAG: hypothetical protein KDN19_17155 [Verrucomicrobiae bacterium]|nr:hypothetical protein [Verrucomicrobiae bacterium]